MALCECGCGGEASPGKRYIQHHQWRRKTVPAQWVDEAADSTVMVDAVTDKIAIKKTVFRVDDGPPVVIEYPNAPPPHPLPYDHGRFRTAEEQPGTDLTQPWRLTRCLECREPTWSHDNTSKTKDEKLCESCAYLLVTELGEKRVAKENRTQRGTYDPFQS